MNEVVHRFTNKGVAGQFTAKQIVPINAQPARRSRPVRRLRIVEPFERPARRKKAVRIGGLIGRRAGWQLAGSVRYVDARRRRGNVWIAPRVMSGQRIVLKQRAVVAAEPVAPIIPHSTLLGKSGRRLEFASVRMKTKIPAADVDLVSATDLSA